MKASAPLALSALLLLAAVSGCQQPDAATSRSYRETNQKNMTELRRFEDRQQAARAQEERDRPREDRYP